MNEGRAVYISHLNVMGEIVSEQRYGAVIRYDLGGFEYTELLTADDYEILDYFNYEEDDE